MYSKLSGYFRPKRSLQRQSSLQTNGYLTSDDSGYYSSTGSRNDPPLRFIIIRHGERIDSTYGRGWTQFAFDYSGQYHPFDGNMPLTLPFRSNWLDYETDTPLTANGLRQSWNVGNTFAYYNLPVTACYVSPAIRSIQTADQILAGMGRKGVVPLRIELGLFECSSWYAHSPITLMSDEELRHSGLYVDTQYRSHVRSLPAFESEHQYYDRSKDTMKKLFKLHRKTGGTVLIVAHAPSIEVLTRHLVNGPPRPEQLIDLSGRVDYCSMTIVERVPLSGSWLFRYSLDEQANRELHIQALSNYQDSSTRPYEQINMFANSMQSAITSEF